MSDSNIKISIQADKILEKYQSRDFGIFCANEWKRLIDPYTPRDTGLLQDTAKIEPFRIIYDTAYARYVYYGYNFNFKKNNPFSTYEWDKAAKTAGQVDKLVRTIKNRKD